MFWLWLSLRRDVLKRKDLEWLGGGRKKNEREKRDWRDWRMRWGGGREKIWVEDRTSGEVKSEEGEATSRNEKGGEKRKEKKKKRKY